MLVDGAVRSVIPPFTFDELIPPDEVSSSATFTQELYQPLVEHPPLVKIGSRNRIRVIPICELTGPHLIYQSGS